MAIRVIPEKQQTESVSRPDIAFTLNVGKKGHQGGLPTWRFCTTTEDDAQAFAQHYGGTPTNEGNRDYPWDVVTTSNEIEVVIDGSKSVYDHLVLWGTSGPPLHDCDGMYSNLAENKGEECGCGGDWEAIKARLKDPVKRRTQAAPVVEFTFTLVGAAEDMGTGKLNAGGVVLAEDAHRIKNELDAVGGPALVVLRKEEITSKNQPQGFVVTRVEVKGSYNDAISEER